MIRSLFATAALAATLLGPGAVRAQQTEGVSAAEETSAAREAGSAPRVTRGGGHATPSMPAGCGCVSSLADILSMPESDAFGGFADLGGEQPLWCESPDDPRCAPARPVHETSLGPSFPTPVSIAAPPITVATPIFLPWTAPSRARGSARPGHAPRVERPPQG